MHLLRLNLEGNEVKDHEIDNISNSITGNQARNMKFTYREKTVHSTTHKTAINRPMDHTIET